jgi:hypothetical protein
VSVWKPWRSARPQQSCTAHVKHSDFIRQGPTLARGKTVPWRHEVNICSATQDGADWTVSCCKRQPLCSHNATFILNVLTSCCWEHGHTRLYALGRVCLSVLLIRYGRDAHWNRHKFQTDKTQVTFQLKLNINSDEITFASKDIRFILGAHD